MSPIDERIAANTRWKRDFRSTLAVSVTLAALAHGLVFEMWPAMSVEVPVAITTTPPTVVPIDEYDLPEAPADIATPAVPVAVPDAGPEATLPTIRFDDVPTLPPPPRRVADGAASRADPFTPFTVAPELRNPEEVQRALEAAYPRILRDARIGGTVVLDIHIDETGRVLDARVFERSEHESLDAAALDLVQTMRFRPALNGDHEVAVWVRMPVVFRAP